MIAELVQMSKTLPWRTALAVLDHRRVLQQMEDQWRGDVVGQVADHSQLLAALHQRGEIELEGVAR